MLPEIWYNICSTMIGDTTLKIHHSRACTAYSTGRERISGRSPRRDASDARPACSPEPSLRAPHQHDIPEVNEPRRFCFRPSREAVNEGVASHVGPAVPLVRQAAPHVLRFAAPRALRAERRGRGRFNLFAVPRRLSLAAYSSLSYGGDLLRPLARPSAPPRLRSAAPRALRAERGVLHRP